MLKTEPSKSKNLNYDDEEEEEDEDEEISEDEISLSEDEEENKKTPNWDSFKDTPYESESISMADTSFIDALIQILKLVAYITTFSIVLFSAVSAKSILLLMTSQLTPNRTITVRLSSMFLGVKLPEEEKYLWIWALLICFSIPELGVMIRSFRIAIFKGYSNDDNFEIEGKKQNNASIKTIFLVTSLMETLHAIGLSLFVFEVLPHTDVAKGVMLTNCVCLVPGLLGVIPHGKLHKKRISKLLADVLAFCFQVSGLVAWPIIFGMNNIRMWVIPVSLAFISCGWWMNYVSEESRLGCIRVLAGIKDKLKNKNVILYKLYIGISIWKILVFFCTTMIILIFQGFNIFDFFDKTALAFSERTILANEVDLVRQAYTDKTYQIPSVGIDIFWIIGAQAASAYVCYIFSKFACRVMIQPFSFAFPCALVVPITIVLIVITTGLRNSNASVFSGFLPCYVFFNSPQIYDAWEFFINEHAWVWVFWIVSQVWITFHIWQPRCERLSKTEKLFATPMYSAFLVDQSVALNRRRDEVEISEKKLSTPHIIACATMWHETRPEMLEMLKSLLRLDNDQCLKSSFRNNVKSPEAEANYYTFEAHIFFDDAFELESEESTKVIINRYVKDFLRIIKKATKNVYGTDDNWIKPPLKYSTPYGGRLEYTLPGENKLFVHLKDKDKIRHKKRWSQVMYMYYLLGFNLMELPIPYSKKIEKAESTYILALDGDIDFKPDAVLLLVDLMKKSPNLGAACGRIHPVGSGFMVWYQLFEYAIGHWLQKATEHMIGCVLCSPGCFSLFRAKALMSPNVMKKYTTRAEEARQFVQYDQGEDRWLCTLLLQRGYRVEYSAASDAYTHCPETFNEFYTQRRRWIPSTMANIVDLLNDYKRTVRVNNDISLPYIAYQMLLLVGTILGPGTILLMLVGAFNTAFKIDNYTAFYYNLIPIIAFMLSCLFTSGKFQLNAALLISLVYGLIMMAVLVGIAMEIKDDGLLSPSSLFLFITAGEIITAGLFHPQELHCLFSGVIYYVTIPSMYLFLIIYSVCNLNVISWGTREGAKKKTKADLENEKKEAEIAEKRAQKTKLFGILDSFTSTKEKKESGNLEFSIANLFKCMCCTREKPDQIGEQYVKIGETLNVLKKKMNDIERTLEGGEVSQKRKSTFRQSIDEGQNNTENTEDFNDNILIIDSVDEDDSRDDLFNPYWIEDKELKKSKFEVLSSQEITFWKELIKNYLSPIPHDTEKEKEVNKGLKELRDKMVVTFFMLNALFVIVIFLLQVNKDQIHIKWPLGAKPYISFNKVTYEITIQKKYLQLEPVGLTFITFFASLLVIQFVSMLFHRFQTLCHLLSNTPLTILKRRKAQSFREKLEYARKQFNKQNREQNMNMQKEIINLTQEVTPRFPVLETERRKSKNVNLDQMYGNILKQMNEDEERETVEREERRKSSLLPWRRGSLQDRKISKSMNAFTNFGLEKINEEH